MAPAVERPIPVASDLPTDDPVWASRGRCGPGWFDWDGPLDQGAEYAMTVIRQVPDSAGQVPAFLDAAHAAGSRPLLDRSPA